MTRIRDEIEKYLTTGDSDPWCGAWPGNVLDAWQRGHQDMTDALIEEIGRRAHGRDVRVPEIPGDLVAFTRRQVEPMVRGLFPRAEQAAVLAVLEKSVVFLTPSTIEPVLRGEQWLRSSWRIANLYLRSIGAEPLGEDVHIVGMSEDTTCYVSMRYFEDQDPFADYVVHEAAHIFHNCKRVTVGLPGVRRREWLLQIEFRKRETFAYACEAYSRIVEHGGSPRERLALAERFAAHPGISDESVEPAEVADIVREASAHRNGWKVIQGRCKPPKPPTRAEFIRRSIEQAARANAGLTEGS